MRMLALLAIASSVFAKEATVDLLNPIYQDGVMTTESGGVVSGKNLRIQAKHIHYDTEKRTLSAEGDLLVEYEKHFFVGKKFTYNFLTKSGTVYDGTTFEDLWFLGGQKIVLLPDGSYRIQGAYVTTSDNKDRDWDIYSHKASVTPDSYLVAQNPKFRVLGAPILILPSLKSDLKWQPKSPVTYQAGWIKGQGPRISAEYRVYSWEDINIFSRLEVRPDFQKLGITGALESSYLPKNSNMAFVSKNFIQKDTFFNDSDPGKESFRFRVQGHIHSENKEKTNTFHTSWDWYDDKNLPLTFQGDNFAHNKAKETEMLIRRIGEKTISGFYFRPRINNFQGFNQQLPALNLSLHPLEIGNSGVMMENNTRAAYLNYVYSDDINGLIPDFRSGRLEMEHNFYRSFRTRAFTFTPLAGFNGIFYTNSPSRGDVGQAIFHYEGMLDSKLYRTYGRYKHQLQPYMHYYGLTFPTIRVDDYFVYSIADGYNRLNTLKPGIKNALFLPGELMPTLSADLYSYAFFGDKTYNLLMPKTYLDLFWNISNLTFGAHGTWNFEEQVLDTGNLSLLWTLNEYFATYFEFRHRSRFDWRKDQRFNFILDVTRSIDELLESPISDGRNTFLSRFQIKLHPEWIVRVRTHMGWGRRDEPSYSEGTVDLLHMVTSSWKMRTSFSWLVPTKGFTAFNGALYLTNHF